MKWHALLLVLAFFASAFASASAFKKLKI